MEYTTDNYIRSYAEQISRIDYPADEGSLNKLIDRLLSWYENEMKKIQESDYIRSKESHKKSYYLLKGLRVLIEKNRKERRYQYRQLHKK